jgi:hypothetical protein
MMLKRRESFDTASEFWWAVALSVYEELDGAPCGATGAPYDWSDGSPVRCTGPAGHDDEHSTICEDAPDDVSDLVIWPLTVAP